MQFIDSRMETGSLHSAVCVCVCVCVRVFKSQKKRNRASGREMNWLSQLPTRNYQQYFNYFYNYYYYY